ncbi:MAG: PEP-CTERM sorting domain-containing protein [Acidobacteriota bacterium]|jgi:hypothetical protein
MRNRLGAALLVAMAFLCLTAPPAQAIPLDIGVYGGTGCCSYGTRGYWFTAPVGFTINELSVPGSGQGQDATIEVVELNQVPPNYSSSTNNFTSLGYWAGMTTVNPNLFISTGTLVGILGYRDGQTPYRDALGPYATTLGGFNITLERFGFQDLGMAHDVWQEPGYETGMIYMDYTPVPEPGTLMLLGGGLAGLAAWRRRRTS